MQPSSNDRVIQCNAPMSGLVDAAEVDWASQSMLNGTDSDEENCFLAEQAQELQKALIPRSRQNRLGGEEGAVPARGAEEKQTELEKGQA